MVIRSIKSRDIFKIIDEDTLTVYYGCNQEWYHTEWQRNSGCGPTVATNIIHYLNCMQSIPNKGLTQLTKSKALTMMEEIWQYVTPTMHGIPTAKLLYDCVIKYAKAKALNIKLSIIDIQENHLLRPEFHHLLLFLDTSLQNDAPIAFLNLDNGAEKQLDSWHWVTIISLSYSSDGSSAVIDILDGGMVKKIDLAKWFRSTRLGGGFVSFDLLL